MPLEEEAAFAWIDGFLCAPLLSQSCSSTRAAFSNEFRIDPLVNLSSLAKKEGGVVFLGGVCKISRAEFAPRSQNRSLNPSVIDWPSLVPVICFAASVRTGTTNHPSLILAVHPSLLSALLHITPPCRAITLASIPIFRDHPRISVRRDVRTSLKGRGANTLLGRIEDALGTATTRRPSGSNFRDERPRNSG